MAKDTLRHADISPDAQFGIGFRRIAPALYKLVTSGDDMYLFAGLSVRKRGGEFLVIVRSDEIVPIRALVCFGSGDTLAVALRNASLAVSKRQWRVDKYASK